MSRRLCLPHMQLANFACYSCLRMLLACACYSLSLVLACMLLRAYACMLLACWRSHATAQLHLLLTCCCLHAATCCTCCSHAAARPCCCVPTPAAVHGRGHRPRTWDLLCQRLLPSSTNENICNMNHLLQNMSETGKTFDTQACSICV
jgi:hypothetical protein